MIRFPPIVFILLFKLNVTGHSLSRRLGVAEHATRPVNTAADMPTSRRSMWEYVPCVFQHIPWTNK